MQPLQRQLRGGPVDGSQVKYARTPLSSDPAPRGLGPGGFFARREVLVPQRLFDTVGRVSS